MVDIRRVALMKNCTKLRTIKRLNKMEQNKELNDKERKEEFNTEVKQLCNICQKPSCLETDKS